MDDNRLKWDIRFMAVADLIATWSKDPDRQVGAVLVRNNQIVSTGYNGLPSAMDDQVLLDKVDKNLVTHAEINAILNASSITAGCTLYSTTAPCHYCAAMLQAKGIVRIVTNKLSESSWLTSQMEGVDMCQAHNIQYTTL